MRIWDVFSGIARRVRERHLAVGLIGHHDWVHAFRVGEVARQIALDEWKDTLIADMAGVAGLLHNTDRILQKEKGGKPTEQEISKEVYLLIGSGSGLEMGAYFAITDAVFRHDRKNSGDDSKTLIAVMDADRVVNLDADLFIRAGQHYANLPAVDHARLLSDPDATYRDPKSVLRDIAYSLDWVREDSGVCVRTRLGRKMAEERANVFRTFFAHLEVQLKEEGIFPYPFAE